MLDRTFETVDDNNMVVKLKIKEATYHINRMCDIEYKKAWAYCIGEGVKVHTQLETALKEANIWGEKEERKIKDLELEVALYLKKMDEDIKANKIDEAKSVALKAALTRNQLTELVLVKQSAFTHSTEGIALEVKLESYVAYSTVYADDETKPYWKNYQDFIAKRDSRVAMDAISKYTQLLVQDHLNTLKELPENKFLMEHQVMTSDLKVLTPEAPTESAELVEVVAAASNDNVDVKPKRKKMK